VYVLTVVFVVVNRSHNVDDHQTMTTVFER